MMSSVCAMALCCADAPFYRCMPAHAGQPAVVCAGVRGMLHPVAAKQAKAGGALGPVIAQARPLVTCTQA